MDGDAYQMMTLIQLHARQMELMQQLLEAERNRVVALEAEIVRLREALHPAVPEPRSEVIPLPPAGVGILRFLRESGYIVEITVSATDGGNTANLVAEDATEWFSPNTANSWIQWILPGGLKARISAAKIRGRIGEWGVKNFAIQGSNDGVSWTDIIHSDTAPAPLNNWVTEARALSGHDTQLFSRIRLLQTGLAHYFKGTNWHHLVLTYVEFGGEVVIPATVE
jgi:hypothetical protein